MGDRTGFAEGEPLVLQPSSIVVVFDWVAALSTLVALSPAIAKHLGACRLGMTNGEMLIVARFLREVARGGFSVDRSGSL